MSGGMYLAAAGALIQQQRLEVLANNVANINTAGYKGDQFIFQIPEGEDARSFETPFGGIQTLSPYAPPFATFTDFRQGALQHTGNPLDMAINGDGFFSIQTPGGIQYTRQGSFALDAEGVLTTPDGYPVLGEGGVITFEEGTVEIDAEGNVFVDGDEVDRLRIAGFPNGDGLKKAGEGRFVPLEPQAGRQHPDNTTLSQGYIEAANVNPVRAMTEMIETSRMFEAYQKVITSADEATAKSIADVGTL